MNDAREERRAYPRVDVSVPVEIDMGPYGPTLLADSVNLNPGGVLLIVGEEIDVGRTCLIRFLEREGVAPSAKTGKVVWAGREGRHYLVAFEFDEVIQTGL